MSRRYRLELERAKDVEREADEEEDKLKLQRQRIYAPVIWQRLASGYRIEDLQENRYEEALNIFKNYHLQEEVLSRNSELADDEISVQCFLKQLLFNIKDTCSIAAINEPNEELAGALVLKVVQKIDFGRVFSRATIVEGDALKKGVKLKNHASRKTDIFAEFDCDAYLRYYAICIKPEHRKKGLGRQLMRSAQSVARSCGVPVVMGMFSSRGLQQIALRLGMRFVHEVPYVQWRDEKSELIFDDPGAGNYTFAVMAGKVPPPPPPEPPRREAAQEAEPKRSRKDKRAELAKKRK